MPFAQTSVIVISKSQTNCQTVFEIKRVLDISGFLFDRRAPVEIKQISAARQIKRQQSGQKIIVRRRRSVTNRAFDRIAVRVETERIEAGIGDAEREFFVQMSALNLSADFDVVDAFNVRNIGAKAVIRQSARLADGRRLIGERIRRRGIINLILPVIRVDGQHGRSVENVNETGRDIECFNFLPLILSQILLLVGVGGLKIVAGVIQIQVENIRR